VGELAILGYSRLRAERRGDHHGLDRGQGPLEGVCKVNRVVRQVEEMLNHLARALAVTLVGQTGKVKSTTTSMTADQSKSAQCGVGGRSMMASGCNLMTIGT